jgi:hypothetical protein
VASKEVLQKYYRNFPSKYYQKDNTQRRGGADVAQWKRMGLAFMRPWVPFPVPGREAGGRWGGGDMEG